MVMGSCICVRSWLLGLERLWERCTSIRASLYEMSILYSEVDGVLLV